MKLHLCHINAQVLLENLEIWDLLINIVLKYFVNFFVDYVTLEFGHRTIVEDSAPLGFQLPQSLLSPPSLPPPTWNNAFTFFLASFRANQPSNQDGIITNGARACPNISPEYSYCLRSYKYK